MPKFKRTLIPGSYLTTADMLHVLSQQNFTAAAVEDTLLLAAEPALAWLLDRCCVGRLVPDTSSSSSSSSSGSSSCITGRVIAAAGVNRASCELQQQYEQYLAVQVQSRKRRKARRMPVYQAVAGLVPPGPGRAETAAAATTVAGGQALAAETPHDTAMGGLVTELQDEAAGVSANHAAQDARHVQQLATAASGGVVETAEYAEAMFGALHKPEDLSVGVQQQSDGSRNAVDDVGGCSADEARAAGTASLAANGTHICCTDAKDNVAVVAVGYQDRAMHAERNMQDTQQHDAMEGSPPLQLVQISCQEAFFMASVLKCCSIFVAEQQAQVHQQQLVTDAPARPAVQLVKQPLAVEELWHWCCAHAAGGALTFVSRYAAYKHFRCKGWLPLPGLLYGADYVLYKLHPENAHSDFVVTVMIERPPEPTRSTHEAIAGTAESNAGPEHMTDCSNCIDLQESLGQGVDSSTSRGSTQLTWLDAHIMQRLARQVIKQFLLLYVVLPQGLLLHSAECLQQIEVREVLLQRWVPSQHREDGKDL